MTDDEMREYLFGAGTKCEYGIDYTGEYSKTIEGAARAAIDFLEAQGLTIDREWLVENLAGKEFRKPSVPGLQVAGIAIRTGVAVVKETQNA